ncbi:MAG TPA: hypothetical protein VGE74_32395 [Gemmata sp.]
MCWTALRWDRARPLGFALAFVIGTSGCGERQFDVTGRVNYNGAPLNKTGGQIVFVGSDGQQVPAEIGADGTYRAVGVAAGLNRVAVVYPNPKGKGERNTKLRAGEPPPSGPPFSTPAMYASPDTSGLVVTVDRGTTFDIEMTGPPVPSAAPPVRAK